MNLPICRAISGRRLGPNRIRANITMNNISVNPKFIGRQRTMILLFPRNRSPLDQVLRSWKSVRSPVYRAQNQHVRTGPWPKAKLNISGPASESRGQLRHKVVLYWQKNFPQSSTSSAAKEDSCLVAHVVHSSSSF